MVMIVFDVVATGGTTAAVVGVDSDEPDGFAFGRGRGRGLTGADMSRF